MKTLADETWLEGRGVVALMNMARGTIVDAAHATDTHVYFAAYSANISYPYPPIGAIDRDVLANQDIDPTWIKTELGLSMEGR